MDALAQREVRITLSRCARFLYKYCLRRRGSMRSRSTHWYLPGPAHF